MNSENKPVQVLFVDDEENILKSIKRLLMDEPYEIVTANSGAAGLDVLLKNPGIGVIVSDQRMPGMSGAEFLEKSRSLAPESVRLVLTGYADITAAVDAINRGGAWKYLAKPWKDDELVQIIRDAAERFTMLAENRRLTEIVCRQNAELKKWNAKLELYVQQQTLDIQKKNKVLEDLNERQRGLFSESIQALAGLIELRDKAMLNHSRNVAKLSGRVAADLRLSAEESETITIAAMLHDIGKIGIADVILAREEAELTEEERKEYRTHGVRGQTALDSVEDLRGAALLIRHHHEAFNGTGFPDGLRGEAIPLGARIIAAADYVDRAIAKSPSGSAVESALFLLRGEVGRRLDPELAPLVATAARALFAEFSPPAESRELELLPGDLKEGMVISRNLLSGTGVLILGKGITLTKKSLASLVRYFHNDPPRGGVFVNIKR
jgi:response regulator RpfG family c-di-GMP phosphodiesterase